MVIATLLRLSSCYSILKMRFINIKNISFLVHFCFQHLHIIVSPIFVDSIITVNLNRFTLHSLRTLYQVIKGEGDRFVTSGSIVSPRQQLTYPGGVITVMGGRLEGGIFNLPSEKLRGEEFHFAVSYELFVRKYVNETVRLPCWPPRGQQVSHQRRISGIHCAHR